jgi:hypothetical protein
MRVPRAIIKRAIGYRTQWGTREQVEAAMDSDVPARSPETGDEAEQTAQEPAPTGSGSDPWFGGPQPPASKVSFGKPVQADAALTAEGDMRDTGPSDPGEFEGIDDTETAENAG